MEFSADWVEPLFEEHNSTTAWVSVGCLVDQAKLRFLVVSGEFVLARGVEVESQQLQQVLTG